MLFVAFYTSAHAGAIVAVRSYAVTWAFIAGICMGVSLSIIYKRMAS